MADTGFTRGPWKHGHMFDAERYWIGPDCDQPVAFVDRDTPEANVLLIKAAPDLYAALEWAYNALGDYGGCSCMTETADCCASSRARTALAKARGEEA